MKTCYAIRLRSAGLFFMGFGTAGQRWGGLETAYPFEFMTTAWCMVLFHLDADPELFDIVPVAG